MRDLIARGTYRIVGTGQVDGRRALKLDLPFGDGPGGFTTLLWVDATTYMLLQVVTTSSDRTASNEAHNSLEYRVLPATQANLSLLTPVIPAGFTHVTKRPFSLW
jgi:hypothetical protein